MVCPSAKKFAEEFLVQTTDFMTEYFVDETELLQLFSSVEISQ